MAKNKGVEESSMMEFIDDESDEYEEPISEVSSKDEPKEKESTGDWVDQLKDEDTSPDAILGLVQGVGSAAIKQALSQSDVLSVAVELKDVIKTLSTTAAQQKRAQAEESKGQGAKDIAIAIAKNNLGITPRKRVDTTSGDTPSDKENPAKKAKPNFGSAIPDYEMEQGVSAPDYNELEKLGSELDEQAKVNAVNKKNS